MYTLPDNIRTAIATVIRECTNGYALTYAHAMDQAIAEGGLYGAVIQINYMLGNMGTWRGDTARLTKETLKAFVKEYRR